MSGNPLVGWSVDPGDITLSEVGLHRPECVLAETAGDLWENGDRAVKTATLVRLQESGAGTTLGVKPGDGLAPRMASVTFGGPDLRTVYVGSLGGTTLPTFRSPVPGAPLLHWSTSS